jgi:hypothetical protein
MNKLSCILFHVNAMDAYPFGSLIGVDIEPPVAGQGEFVLGNLVTFGQVGIEVVLAGELAVGSDSAMGGEGHPESEFDHVAIQYGKHAGHTEAHRAGVGIGTCTEGRGTAAENLALREKLGVYFQSDDRFVCHEALHFVPMVMAFKAETRLYTIAGNASTLLQVAYQLTMQAPTIPTFRKQWHGLCSWEP